MIHLFPGFCKEITDVRYQQGICMIGSCLCYIDLHWLQVLWVILTLKFLS